ncbi:lyase family protein [Puniceibacterium sediminis]|uniref:3-carboxy-cis,cis-muconate cycloisomerase n=1 Tax=Puniceibacterium sediminis TaxID=1608407 RepID=A0A238Y306_9RHOB|nr:lyase family protein [Puniceibacterium sediminis]SNR64954.1 3-carboxy-cis,cis-muconate cycloisomerase [Puniceibacterium sediminis]
MPASPFDSAHLSKLFDTGEAARLFSDSAEIRAMLLVEGALAKVQGAAGVIPELSAAAIHRATLEIQMDPAGLAEATGQNGVSVPALVTAFRALMQAPEHAQYLHWGATSQDILDTALMLRLRQGLALFDAGLDATLKALATLSAAHADTPMAARTYGQHATPTSFGATVAAWGWPLLTLLEELRAIRAAGLPVSLSGAAGTATELGADAPALRAALAEALGLSDPGHSWHSDRTVILRLAAWITRTATALGKMGEDLLLLTQSGLAEVRLGGAGGSSTMPQKQNPVAPSVLVALSHHALGLNTTLQGAGLHRQQRDGAAWFTEWLTLPSLCLSLSAALKHAQNLAETLAPNTQAMSATLDSAQGLLAAEALSFALTSRMSRPDAQAEVKMLCKEVIANGTHLRDAALARWPDLPPALFLPDTQMGQAPHEARAFAAAVRAL